jgi:hypothetical protein
MNMQRRVLGLALVLLPLLVILAIIVMNAFKQGDTKPSVQILAPPDQYSIPLGQTLQVESQARDDGGVSRIDLYIGDILVHTAPSPDGGKSFRVSQSWFASAMGVHDVRVIAYDDENQASDAATIRVTVESLPGPTATPAPLASPTPTPGPEPTGPGGCIYDAAFVTDVTIPDNTELAPGTDFVKTWRLRNSGTCDWGTNFQFVFVGGGDQMGAPAAVSVSPTAAGATVDVSAPFKAPQQPGTYRSQWRMRAPDGQDFGDRPFVQIVVPPPATPTPQVTPTATPGPKPDLDITLVAGNLALEVGQTMELRVTVKNHGPGASEAKALVRAVLWADLTLETNAPALPSGAQETVSLRYTFDAPAGLDVAISVDPQGQIAEGDEDNNSEWVSIVVNPSLYATGTITATPDLRFDLDDGADEVERLDVEWRVVEGLVYVGLLNGAGAAPLSGEAESVSYALVAGLTWEPAQLLLADLAEGTLFGFRTNEGRVGYARVAAVLDSAYTSVQLDYWVWDWP